MPSQHKGCEPKILEYFLIMVVLGPNSVGQVCRQRGSLRINRLIYTDILEDEVIVGQD